MNVAVTTVSYRPTGLGGEVRQYDTLHFEGAIYCKVNDNGVLEIHSQEEPLLVHYFAPGTWTNVVVKGGARE